MRKLADTLYDAVVESDAPDVQAQWAGFGRFCREVLGAEPVTVVQAFGVATEEPAVELVCTEAEPLGGTEWAEQWTRSWGRRFGGR